MVSMFYTYTSYGSCIPMKGACIIHICSIITDTCIRLSVQPTSQPSCDCDIYPCTVNFENVVPRFAPFSTGLGCGLIPPHGFTQSLRGTRPVSPFDHIAHNGILGCLCKPKHVFPLVLCVCSPLRNPPRNAIRLGSVYTSNRNELSL